MEKKNGHYYFERYDEIRDFLAQDFPVSVVLERSEEHEGGELMSDGHVDSYSCNYLGGLEDFPATEYYTEKSYVACPIKADAMLDGLYAAAEQLAPLLQISQKGQRTLFTANDLTAPIDKGGVLVDYPCEPEPMYVITTKTGCYKVAAAALFLTIVIAEKGVSADKRRRFTIQSAAAKGKVLARFAFEADKIMPKLKGTWDDKDSLRHVMKQPAIDPEYGVMVSSDGRMLVAHKLQAFESNVTKTLPWSTVSVPKEIVSMKGRVTVEVYLADSKSESKNAANIRVCVTDSKGHYAEVCQDCRYPNYLSVFPSEVGPAIPIDTAAFTKVVRQLVPNLSPYGMLMVLVAKRGADAITLSGDNIDDSRSCSVTMPVGGGVPSGICIGLKASLTLQTLAFNPTKMYFTDPKRCVLFETPDTMIIQLPMLLNDNRADGFFMPDSEKSKFSIAAWLKGTRSTPTGPKPKKVKSDKVKGKINHKPLTLNHKPATASAMSFADMLRKALLVA